MPSSSDKEKLLNDLLRDANYEAFRAEVFDLSRAEFQAKHRARSRAVYLALAASIAILGAVLALSFSAKKPPEKTATPRNDAVAFQLDQVPPITLIETTQLEPVEVIRSFPDRSLLVSTSSHRTVDLVYSDLATVSEVNDAQLLALFPHETVGFVTTPRGRKLIVIADAAPNLQFPFGKKSVR
jgi:hypothetical protein